MNTSQNHEQNVEHLSSKLTYGKEAIEWRRAKILELSSQGRSPREIADIIHVGIGTVNRDLSYLNKQARELKNTYPRETARTISKMYEWITAGVKDRLEYCK